MKKTRIHINQHNIKKDMASSDPHRYPVITVKEGRTNTYCHEVKITGEVTVRYGGNDKPILPCGARVVIETDGFVEIVNPTENIKAELVHAN